jgi:hypothetical protein
LGNLIPEAAQKFVSEAQEGAKLSEKEPLEDGAVLQELAYLE